MNLEFLPEAQAEFYEAVGYYEGTEKDLGKRFRDEVWEVCSTILDHPVLWRERADGFRRGSVLYFSATSHTSSVEKRF